MAIILYTVLPIVKRPFEIKTVNPLFCILRSVKKQRSLFVNWKKVAEGRQQKTCGKLPKST